MTYRFADINRGTNFTIPWNSHTVKKNHGVISFDYMMIKYFLSYDSNLFDNTWPKLSWFSVSIREVITNAFLQGFFFCTAVKNICNVIKLWCMEHFSLEGKVTAFKTFAISKIVYMALLTNLSHNVIEELNKIQKKFL